jgi:hypothetical protein|tara:strand:- start:267 stop:494 length:228 start_codon:yes stop_codon:yes gene_type:complete
MQVGDMVKAAYFRSDVVGIFHTGIIVGIDEVTDLFSEKYAITETSTYIRVLSKGDLMTFDLSEDQIEVISESYRS